MKIMIFVFFIYFVLGAFGEEVTFELGPLGYIKGVTTETKVYPDAPYSGRPYYKFRNLPYIEGSVAGEHRFKQSSVRLSPYSENNTDPYDATRSGPLCMQGSLGTLHIDTLLTQSLEDFLIDLLPDEIGGLVPVELVEALLGVIEFLTELPAGTLDGKKPVVDVLHDWLDVDFGVSEECLSLSVWTPINPDGVARANLPVMYYIFAGGFNGGFSYKMGGERLGAFEDVVVVAINYRVGPLGFLCLDTEEAAGNMGVLDMVVGLEWVQKYISYFGGDPSRVTLFGDSAGSASIGHLMLSSEASGLFSQAIGSSGSAISDWAFTSQASSMPYNKALAAELSCDLIDNADNPDNLVECLRNIPAEEIASTWAKLSSAQRANGELGFGGSQPCGQTKGPRMLYSADQTPTDILFSNDYNPVPIMYGATKYEGSSFYAEMYTSFIQENNLTDNEDFFKHDAVSTFMKMVGVSQYYGMKQLLTNTYFDPEMIGKLDNMMPGFFDLLSVFVIKAPSYELMSENSKHAPSYWYAFDYDSPQKHLFNVFYLGSDHANIENPGPTHCEDVPYLFDVEVPLIFCDLEDMINDALDCFNHPLDAVLCLALPGGQFRSKWHDCLTGQLSDEELSVSGNVVKAWTSFASRGHPGFGAAPWTRENPQYLKFDKEVSVEFDYAKEYNIAFEESRNISHYLK